MTFLIYQHGKKSAISLLSVFLFFVLLCGNPAAYARVDGESGREFKDCPNCPEMVVIPRGDFVMASSEGERQKEIGPELFISAECPQHLVTIQYDFALGKYPITFDEWDACVADGGCNGYVPSDEGWGRGRRPVININRLDALAYVLWLDRKLKNKYETNKSDQIGYYGVPTEAEWEYAARAGTETARYWGDAIGSGNTNCAGCGSQWDSIKTAPVGSFPPNQFGLYDILGNVWQYTEDCWHENYEGAPTDGSAWKLGACHDFVRRGGGWNDKPWAIRAASRSFGPPTLLTQSNRSADTGFRVSKTLMSRKNSAFQGLDSGSTSSSLCSSKKRLPAIRASPN